MNTEILAQACIIVMAFVKIMWICGYILAVGVDLPLKQI
jgi:hypothetical protein